MNLQFIDAGQFRTPLILQENRPFFDEYGGFQDQWTEIAHCWGQIEPQNSAALQFAQQNIAHISHHITVRFRKDISTAQRFVRQARVFTILGYRDPDETQRYLICSVREEKP